MKCGKKDCGKYAEKFPDNCSLIYGAEINCRHYKFYKKEQKPIEELEKEKENNHENTNT